MKNGKFIYELTKVQNFPRWDDYVPRFQDNTASHSYRCAVYGLIASLVENELYQGDVDVLKVVCRSVFHDLNETITGTMKHKTKKDPLVAEHIKRLEKSASEKMVSYLSKSLQPIFKDFIVDAEDSSAEGCLVDAIDTFDAMLFCYRETKFNSATYFVKKYEELAASLRNHTSASIRWMVEQVDRETDVYKFMMSVMGLDRVGRWMGKFNTIQDNDATHCFRTASLAIFLGYLEREKYDVEIDMLKLVGRTLLHDLPEDYTGDVLGPVKHSSEETKEAFGEYERKVGKQMVDLLPEFLREQFIDYVVNAKDADYEGELVDIVDKLDALIKSSIEKRVNAFEYELTYRRQLNRIQEKYENPSVIFFLAYILHDLDNPMMQMD